MMNRKICVVALAFLGFLAGKIVNAGTPEEWRGRTIYQLLTDRFGHDGGSDGCSNLSTYCGGTFQGIIDHLDYIQGMGFDAIWISPVPENYPGGYHGYWQTNIEQINSNFGSANDLQNLVNAAHQKGIWVMVDVVANHVGPVNYDYSGIVPFNQDEHYHDCTICPSGCSINDFNNQAQVEWCRLAGLPDLDQSNSFVNSTWNNWIKSIVQTYGFDGIRIDTVPEVEKDFWFGYVRSAGVYTVGEVFNGDPNYVTQYQAPKGPLAGVLSYPLFFNLRDVFTNYASMYQLQSINQQYASVMGDVSLLGTFIDNHDNARFLNEQGDTKLYENALMYTIISEGIPIIYYGSEQGFNGGSDPNNREVLWTTNYNTQTPLYQFIAEVVNFRKQAQVWNYPQIQRYCDDRFYAFTRGTSFVALTNGGSNQGQITRTITYHPYSNGTKLCNLFYPSSDCVTVANGSFNVYLQNGECKIYSPSS